jgi:hypothetical protein
MAFVKVVLYPRAKKDGTYPLALRITKNRKSSYIFLEYSIRKEDWSADDQRVKSSHPNSTRLNHFLIKERADASDTSLEVETQKQDVPQKPSSRKSSRQADRPSLHRLTFI